MAYTHTNLILNDSLLSFLIILHTLWGESEKWQPLTQMKPNSCFLNAVYGNHYCTHSSVGLNQGQFWPPGTPGNVWRHFWLPQLGEGQLSALNAGILWVEAKDAPKHPRMHRAASYSKVWSSPKYWQCQGSDTLVYILSLAIFVLKWGNWIVVTGTPWPTTPNVFTTGPLQKVCQFLPYRKIKNINKYLLYSKLSINSRKLPLTFFLLEMRINILISTSSSHIMG